MLRCAACYCELSFTTTHFHAAHTCPAARIQDAPTVKVGFCPRHRHADDIMHAEPAHTLLITVVMTERSGRWVMSAAMISSI